MIAETRLDVPANLPPMAGGLVGYLGYDMVRLMERLPLQNPDVIGVPDALMLRPTLFAIFDNVNDELTLGGAGVFATRYRCRNGVAPCAEATGRGGSRARSSAAAPAAAGDAA